MTPPHDMPCTDSVPYAVARARRSGPRPARRPVRQRGYPHAGIPSMAPRRRAAVAAHLAGQLRWVSAANIAAGLTAWARLPLSRITTKTRKILLVSHYLCKFGKQAPGEQTLTADYCPWGRRR